MLPNNIAKANDRLGRPEQAATAVRTAAELMGRPGDDPRPERTGLPEAEQLVVLGHAAAGRPADRRPGPGPEGLLRTSSEPRRPVGTYRTRHR
jgi:hypothetical protein